ncbi:MAG: calcium-binding protein [Gaiellaceae bacterium]
MACLLVAALLSVIVGSPSAATPTTITGTSRADVLRGSKGPDVIRGLAGADRLFGYGGNDRLEGGSGGDVLVGGPGRDVLRGGAGNDRINARDGERDLISCGLGRDTVLKDVVDVLDRDCPPVGGSPPPPRPDRTVILDNEPWLCLGTVDLDLVKVTLRTTVEDAIRLDRNCSGRVGRIEVDTWTADGIKVQNRGTVAHDLVIESGYVKCHDVAGDYHQDGIQAMGGYRITFRNLRIDCLRNSNLFLARGGAGASTPTDIVCEGCVLGPNTAQTLFFAPSLRSGARRTTICTGRYRAIRIHPEAVEIVNVGNKVLPHTHPSCADVTGRGRTP